MIDEQVSERGACRIKEHRVAELGLVGGALSATIRRDVNFLAYRLQDKRSEATFSTLEVKGKQDA